MKRIISVFLTLVLCVGLFAALGTSAYAADYETKTVDFPWKFTNTQSGDVTVSGTYISGDWCLSYMRQYYDFTVSVPDNCRITKVTYTLDYNNRWPYVSDGTVSTPDDHTLEVTFAPEDCVHSVKLYGLETYNGDPMSAEKNIWQFVDALTVEYTPPHTHEKNANDYHAAVAPTCGDGSVEYWGCTNPGCNAKLDANGNVIEDITVPATEEHSFSDTWSFDETHHWHASTCGCDVKADYAEHTYSDAWSYDKDYHWHDITCGCGAEPERTEHKWKMTGVTLWSRTYKCDCGAEKTVSLLGSTLSEGNGVIVIVIAAAAVIAVGALVIVKKKRVKS